jgi:kynurenine formamidase
MGKKVFVDLSHPFGADIPLWPYFNKPVIDTMHGQAKSGVLSQKVSVVMHAGTHADSPRHVMERDFEGKRARYTHELPVDAYCGQAICLDLNCQPWQLVDDKDLDAACKKAKFDPNELKNGMVLVLRTGMHLLYDDSKDYYHYSAGTGLRAGQWIEKYHPKCVAMDCQALDHPLHTAMGKNGPTQMNLPGRTGRSITQEYIDKFGIEKYARFDREVFIQTFGMDKYMEEYGKLEKAGEWGTWEPCHKYMMGNGIVGVENLGGDLEKVVGKRFQFWCFPLRWYMGDGTMVRCVAEIDDGDLTGAPDRIYKYGVI